jgi:hypothetical protein
MPISPFVFQLDVVNIATGGMNASSLAPAYTTTPELFYRFVERHLLQPNAVSSTLPTLAEYMQSRYSTVTGSSVESFCRAVGDLFRIMVDHSDVEVDVAMYSLSALLLRFRERTSWSFCRDTVARIILGLAMNTYNMLEDHLLLLSLWSRLAAMPKQQLFTLQLMTAVDLEFAFHLTPEDLAPVAQMYQQLAGEIGGTYTPMYNGVHVPAKAQYRVEYVQVGAGGDRGDRGAGGIGGVGGTGAFGNTRGTGSNTNDDDMLICRETLDAMDTSVVV